MIYHIQYTGHEKSSLSICKILRLVRTWYDTNEEAKMAIDDFIADRYSWENYSQEDFTVIETSVAKVLTTLARNIDDTKEGIELIRKLM